MAPVGPLRERPVRDGLLLISPFSSVHSLSCGLHRERSHFSCIWSKKWHNLWFTFNVCRYLLFQLPYHSQADEVPSQFQFAMVHSQVQSGSVEFLVVLWPSTAFSNLAFLVRYLRIRIRTLLFSSMTDKMPTKNKFFPQGFLLITF
jgi:hypothetical protein